MRRTPVGALFAACLVAAFLSCPAAAPAAETGFVAIDVQTRPITRFGFGSETRFGALEFRGGLQLVSANPDFGSLSGLDFAADGRTLYAVADTGFWFTAKVIEENGRLVGIEQPMIAPLLDVHGDPITTKDAGDAEGLRIVMRDGRQTALVSFEQTPAISRYVAAPDFATARRQPVPLPKFVNKLRRNLGLESVAVAPANGPLAGAIVTLAERSLDSKGNHRGFVLSGPRAGTFSIVRDGKLDLTDAAFLPDGDLIVLERHFDFKTGLDIQIRRFPVSAIRPGATIDGTVLFKADLSEQIDNLEGMAVRVTESGETMLTLVSDDNQNRLLQRTILLDFVLVPPTPPVPQPRPG